LSLRETLINLAEAALDAGDSELSLRGLARMADVSAMAPYRHFADKAALLAAVAERGFATLREELANADRTEGGEEALVAQGLAYLAFARRHPAAFRLMFKERGEFAAISKVGQSAYDILAHRVALVAPSDPEAATLACWAMVHGLATMTLDRRLDVDEGQARRVLQLLVKGLRAG
jgi:AcrR family transcriptional regulator